MKILIPCSECHRSDLPKSIYYSDVEFEENGTYKLTCFYGHESVVFLLKHQFQVLFDFGIMALLDGYTREAVSSFASSVERFYEFCMEVFLEKNKINYDEFKKTWKFVSSQSERQLGAFYLLYLNEFNKAPEKIKDSWVTFRNHVIHKGHIPKSEMVWEYAKYLYEYMKNILLVLMENHSGYMEKWFERRQQSHKKENENGTVVIYSSFIDIYNKTPSSFKTLSFDQSLDFMKLNIKHFYKNN